MACTLYYLSDKGRLCTTANAFGLSRQCASEIVREVCTAITVFLRVLPSSLRMLIAEFHASSFGFAFPCGQGFFENAHGGDADLFETDKNNCVFENIRHRVDGVLVVKILDQ